MFHVIVLWWLGGGAGSIGQHKVFSLALHLVDGLMGVGVSLWTWSLPAQLGWLASNPRNVPVSVLELHTSAPSFHVGAGDQMSILTLAWQTLHQLSHLPRPCLRISDWFILLMALSYFTAGLCTSSVPSASTNGLLFALCVLISHCGRWAFKEHSSRVHMPFSSTFRLHTDFC